MANVIKLKAHNDYRGSLISIEKCLPFNVKRTFFIYDIIGKERGGHRHKVCWQAMVVIHGSCSVYCNNGIREQNFVLDDPKKLLILKPEDWHKMYDFKNNAILIVLASHNYDVNDYIQENYQ